MTGKLITKREATILLAIDGACECDCISTGSEHAEMGGAVIVSHALRQDGLHVVLWVVCGVVIDPVEHHIGSEGIQHEVHYLHSCAK